MVLRLTKYLNLISINGIRNYSKSPVLLLEDEKKPAQDNNKDQIDSKKIQTDETQNQVPESKSSPEKPNPDDNNLPLDSASEVEKQLGSNTDSLYVFEITLVLFDETTGKKKITLRITLKLQGGNYEEGIVEKKKALGSKDPSVFSNITDEETTFSYFFDFFFNLLPKVTKFELFVLAIIIFSLFYFSRNFYLNILLRRYFMTNLKILKGNLILLKKKLYRLFKR